MPEALVYSAQAGSLLYICYRALLSLLGLLPYSKDARGQGTHRFLIMVPARNEEAVIAATVQHILCLSYPASMRRLIVVADDCSDRTAEAAEASGAELLRKYEPASGKGSALRWALHQPSVRFGEWDALIVLDADSRPEPDFLLRLDAALGEGVEAAQARTVGLEQQNWWSQGYVVHQTQRNRLWHLARERSGMPAALTGAGICLKRDLLERVPFETRTVTEDLEYTALLTVAGVKPHFLYDCVVQIQGTPGLSASVHQRLRWARGQILTALRFCPRLVIRSIMRRDIGALDQALYLALPSLMPLQALLLSALLADALLAGQQVFAPAATAAIVIGSLSLHPFAVLAEHRKFSFASWLGFAAIMLTWLPVAAIAALTMHVRSWRPTPREAQVRERVAVLTKPE